MVMQQPALKVKEWCSDVVFDVRKHVLQCFTGHHNLASRFYTQEHSTAWLASATLLVDLPFAGLENEPYFDGWEQYLVEGSQRNLMCQRHQTGACEQSPEAYAYWEHGAASHDIPCEHAAAGYSLLAVEGCDSRQRMLRAGLV
jgi:hypothetical protein